MKRRPLLTPPFAFLTAVLFCMSPLLQTSAQTDTRQPPPAFGSSLKRPKEGAKHDAARPAEEAEEEVVTVDTSLVLLDVLVTDKTGTRAVEGLTKEDFVVREDGRSRPHASFKRGLS